VNYFRERPPAKGWQDPKKFDRWAAKSKAWKYHQPFKRHFDAKLGDQWTLYGMQIHAWLQEQEAKNEDNGSTSAVDLSKPH
jgi:hypothetical protein